jgi:PAS domain S-box-containing protein
VREGTPKKPETKNQGPRWRLYGFAVVLTAVTLLLRLGMTPWDGGQSLLILFLFPIVISAFLGGLGPGLLATGLTAVVSDYFLLPPIHAFGFASPVAFAHWLFLLVVGVLISVLFNDLDRLRRGLPDEALEGRHITTERKVSLGFAAALTLLGIIGIVSYLSVVRLNENSKLVAHSQLVMASIDAIVATTLETESANRGYIVSGEELFAADYTRAVGRVEGLFLQLRDAARENPQQLARVEPLAEAVRTRLAHSSRILDLRRTGGLEAVQRYLAQNRTRPGVALQTRVRDLAREMKFAEIRLLNEREHDAAQSALVTQAVIVCGSALALTLVGLAIFAIRRDYAGRARAEAELSRFFDLSLDLFVIAGIDGYFKRVSRAITGMLGYSVDEALRIPFMEFVHPDDKAATARAVLTQVVGGESVDQFVNRYRHKNGSWRTFSWRSVPRGKLMYASARDVTDSVRAELELREAKEQLEMRVAERTRDLEVSHEALSSSERRFRALIENGIDGVVLIDSTGHVRYVSPAVMNIEGYTPEELIGQRGRVNAHPDDVPVLTRALAQLKAEPAKPVRMVWRQRHKDGHWMWLEGIATNLLDDPSVRAIVTNYRDITERLAHETRLAEQLQRLALLSRITRAVGERQDLRSIFQVVVARLEEELPVDFCGICMHDAGEHSLTVNCIGARSESTAEQLDMTHGTKVPIDENGLARCVRGQLVYEPDIAATSFPFPQRLAGAGLGAMVIAPLLVESKVFGVLICARRPARSFSSGECEFLRQASEHTALAANQAQLHEALQQAYDDLRQTQQQFMQQERLRALGQMASGIAHDINNAISPVALYTEALLEREPLSERARGHLEIIQRAVDDVAQTVARMGEFYRQREPQLALVPVNLNKLVRQVVDLTRARWSDMALQRGVAIEMRLELAARLAPIAAAESQIRDALVNLVFNAVDAMPQGGVLTLRTRLASVNGDASARDPSVILEISDTGVGMDEETRKRCLEPFFTTKGTRGTGMGLAMVYGVAQRHAATLELESEPGKGTLVRLAFNVAPDEPAVTSGRHKPPVGSMKILVVDDDPLLLKSLRDALESDGHDVTVANGGQAGIDAFLASHAAGAPYPVVITDLGMPHVDGSKVAATVKATLPATFVVMLTGWGRRLVVESEMPPGVDVVLSKPPKIAELRTTLAARFAKEPSQPSV